jgi:hypothetical protein
LILIGLTYLFTSRAIKEIRQAEQGAAANP